MDDKAQLKRRYDRAVEGIDAPLAVVDLNAFDANLHDLARRAAGRPIRVASKSIRCRELLKRALDHESTAGVLAYSLPEALWLHAEGVCADIVVAYPTVNRQALRELAANEEARASITVMVDSVDHLNLVDEVLGAGHPVVRVCLELDVSWRPARGVHIGARRSSIFTAEQAVDLAREIDRRPGFTLVGLMGYEGHIAGVPDRAGVRSAAVRAMQRASAEELNERRAQVVAAVRHTANLEFVNGGGTGSVEDTVQDESVTEIAAGSGLLAPTLFDGYTRFRPRPAAFFALPVVRKPARTVATLFSGGYVASGPAEDSRLPSPALPPGLRLRGMEGAGEVQTPVIGRAARRLAVGDNVWLRHAKAGELAERFDAYHLIDGDRLAATVPTYRGEGRNFG